MTDEKMHLAGKALVQTMMRSASIDKIRPLDWWTRARSALEGAARSSSSFSGLVSAMARKLQIDAAGPETSTDLAFLADEVPAADFPAFRRFCEREALYIVAMARASSEERKAEWKAKQGAKRAAGLGSIHPSGIDTIQDSYDLAADMIAAGKEGT